MKIKQISVFLFFLLHLSIPIFAQPDPEPGPIDGGILWLLVGAFFLAFNSFFKRKKN